MKAAVISNETEKNLEIRIEIEKVNGFLVAVLLVFTFIPIIGIIVGFLISQISMGTVLFTVVLILVAYYFLRLFLWNWRGKEIIEINKEEITQTVDYWLFQEKNIIDNQDLELIVFENSKKLEISDDEILDDEIDTAVNYEKIILQSKVYKSVSIQINGLLTKEIVDKVANRLDT